MLKISHVQIPSPGLRQAILSLVILFQQIGRNPQTLVAFLHDSKTVRHNTISDY